MPRPVDPRRAAAVAAGLALLAAACEFNLTQPSPAGSSSANTTTVTVNTPPGGGGTPTTTTIPGSAAPLPLPAGAQATVAAVASANPGLLANSCQSTAGAAAWAYLDLVVDTLRAADPRWGYACRPGNCAAPVEDAIAYYAASGAPATGALGVHVVDIIGGWCGTNPAPAWLPLPYDAARGWTSRGRF